MLGVNKGTVVLMEQQEAYPALFQAEKELLGEIFGNQVVAIEHIGSTAIKGIQAKPIIDIMIGVEDLDNVEKLDKRKMVENDYYFLKVKLEGKVVAAKFSSLEHLTKTYILHIVEHGGDWWQKHLLFRDRLNAEPALALQYEQLKLRLAEQYPTDEAAYTDGKEAFVNQVVQKKI
ncbi:GrpB family protein [Halalkalibacillus halophilus]|uniref:GrpB family protein n=1 Tax=Halalkalibacillus halophilus TaxID=392827 RepID=UPI0004144978|nr:GrpB family protein [Halalkalibacillus halophilus]